jgi:hypothetical protein
MSRPFTAYDHFSVRSRDPRILRYLHRIVWNEDGKKWDCVKCHRSSGFRNKYEALIELAQHDCISFAVAQEA